LSLFEITPDYDLNLMSTSQTLSGISVRILESLSKVLEDYAPDLVVVHGDTTTTFMASLASFYKQIPVAHVEAGLRTGNLYSPWPEELNRRLTGLVADLHFAPTPAAGGNLLSEKVDASTIHVTGNTVIDALMQTSSRLANEKKLLQPLTDRFAYLNSQKKLLLVTGHRRENFGDGMTEICKALLLLSERGDVEIIYAVHLNPNVKATVDEILQNRPNIHLLPPQDYLSFVYLMKRCHFILTDSGGIQEEAPSLGKPVLVMRDTTERPEAIEAGTALLVKASASRIVEAAAKLLDCPDTYDGMSRLDNPYGDGQAAPRIVHHIMLFLANRGRLKDRQ
jgi:UDP-N-acetylglucosamine 2-epimerase